MYFTDRKFCPKYLTTSTGYWFAAQEAPTRIFPQDQTGSTLVMAKFQYEDGATGVKILEVPSEVIQAIVHTFQVEITG